MLVEVVAIGQHVEDSLCSLTEVCRDTRPDTFHYAQIVPKGQGLSMKSKNRLFERLTAISSLFEACQCADIVAHKLKHANMR